jgi:hypothetical protein
MTGFAKRVEIATYAGSEQDRRREFAPYRDVLHKQEVGSPNNLLSKIGMLAAFLIFSGVAVAISRGQAGIVANYKITPESLLVVAWSLQGAAALLFFVLAVRWLRAD